MSARVLVTGGNGFVGRAVCRALRARGAQALAADVAFDPDLDDAPWERARCDLLDSAQIESLFHARAIDRVIHAGAISGPMLCSGNPATMHRVNAVGTLNLLEACAAVGHTPRKLLIASSANVYGNVTSNAIDESFPVTPVNHYAASKAAMETMVRTWFDRLPILIVRPFNYTGRGQASNFLVPKIVELGPLSEGLRVIRAGLTAQDKVIIGGNANPMVRTGVAVTPQPGEIKVATTN